MLYNLYYNDNQKFIINSITREDLMNLKNFFKACAGALLYFAIYYGWQLIAANWASFAAAWYAMITAGEIPPAGSAEYIDWMIAIENDVYELIMKYSLHLTLISGILALVTFFIIMKARKKRPLADIGLTRLNPWLAVELFGLGAALNVFVTFAMSIIPFPVEWVNSYTESSSLIADANIVISIIVTVISAPIVEEVTFRGFMYGQLKKGMPMFAAMLISSWVFGMVHGDIIWFLYAFALGVLLVYVFEKCGSLTASVIVHMAFNLFGSLTGLLGEMSETTFFILLVSSGLVSLALLIHIGKSSERKISFLK